MIDKQKHALEALEIDPTGAHTSHERMAFSQVQLR